MSILQIRKRSLLERPQKRSEGVRVQARVYRLRLSLITDSLNKDVPDSPGSQSLRC